MAKAYWVVTYRSMKNEKAWGEYAKLAVPALTGAGGRFLVAGMPTKAWESGMNQRVVLVEFDSLQKAIAAHDTPAYKEALRALGNAADRDIRVVEGVA
jgi:uncharacterized protein (DUF1330 family)